MEDIINNKYCFQESEKKIKFSSFLENDNSYINNFINLSKKKVTSEELSKETSFHNNKKSKGKIRQSVTPFLKLKKIALFKNNLKLQKIKNIKRMQENLLISNDNKNCLTEQNSKKIINKPLKNYVLYNKLYKNDSKENKILVKKKKKVELNLLTKALLIENGNCSKLKYKDISTQKNNNNDNFFMHKYSLTEASIKNLYLKNQLTGISTKNFCKSNNKL